MCIEISRGIPQYSEFNITPHVACIMLHLITLQTHQVAIMVGSISGMFQIFSQKSYKPDEGAIFCLVLERFNYDYQ